MHWSSMMAYLMSVITMVIFINPKGKNIYFFSLRETLGYAQTISKNKLLHFIYRLVIFVQLGRGVVVHYYCCYCCCRWCCSPFDRYFCHFWYFFLYPHQPRYWWVSTLLISWKFSLLRCVKSCNHLDHYDFPHRPHEDPSSH